MSDISNQLTEPTEDSNTSSNPHFNDIINAQLQRRSVLTGGAGLTAAAMLGGLGLAACGGSDASPITTPQATPTPSPATPMPAPAALQFKAVPHSTSDLVTVPDGYQVEVLYSTGDPFATAIAPWKENIYQRMTQRSGDNHDGMHFFGLKGGKFDLNTSNTGLLCLNHEYIQAKTLHTGPVGSFKGYTAPKNGKAAVYRPAKQVRLEVDAHGASVIEVARKSGSTGMDLKMNSMYNRRITSATEMKMTGPAAGSDLLVTRFSKNGTKTRGMNNNCANGYTPWGTYLTCEENFRGVFSRDASDADTSSKRSAKEKTALTRYGFTKKAVKKDAQGNAVKDAQGNDVKEFVAFEGYGYSWARVDASEAEEFPDEFKRWNITAMGTSAKDDYRNAANTFGWIVEIDPFDPQSTPVKHTAMGRFAHECCWPAPAVAGQPVVFYSGDDARGEYLYKFVSDAVWDPKDVNGGMKAGEKYLSKGTLYVARFKEGTANSAVGVGEWVELTFGKNGINAGNATYAFKDQADVLTHCRLAADTVGATRMDRPEWTAVSPVTGEVYLTLTNNKYRGDANKYPTYPANPRHYDGGNVHGHIIRWKEDGGRHNATSFTWDVYLFGSPEGKAANINLSKLDASNDFSSPDGLWFDPRGVLWIQTDDGAYTDTTNCMMLAALPNRVGDGKQVTAASEQTGGTKTYLGAEASGVTLKRFLTGPAGCEVTGIAMTQDAKTMFVNIQHPGHKMEDKVKWPANEANASAYAKTLSKPRSSTLVITHKAGGRILEESYS